MKPRFWLLVATLLAAVLVPGCGNVFDSDSVKSALTEHQRDSVLAKSVLPGAGVVGRAMQASDRAAQRAAGLDASLDSLAR